MGSHIQDFKEKIKKTLQTTVVISVAFSYLIKKRREPCRKSPNIWDTRQPRPTSSMCRTLIFLCALSGGQMTLVPFYSCGNKSWFLKMPSRTFFLSLHDRRMRNGKKIKRWRKYSKKCSRCFKISGRTVVCANVKPEKNETFKPYYKIKHRLKTESLEKRRIIPYDRPIWSSSELGIVFLWSTKSRKLLLWYGRFTPADSIWGLRISYP